MTKNETKKLLNTIKGYYNTQFFIDEYVIDAWSKTMEKYDLEDAEKHIESYLKENPDTPPKPHTFIKGLYTHDEKEMIRNSSFTVECNLCHRWMPLQEYDEHYGKCLDIQYLISVAKEKGENITREDLENTRQDIIDRLLQKYEPKVDDDLWNVGC